MKRSFALIGFLLLPTSVFTVSACSSLSINTSGAEDLTAKSVLTQSSGQQLAQSNEVAQAFSPEAEKALTEIARAITVKISTKDNGGSGVLIGKQGNNYLILTNAHVVRSGKTFEVKTEDGQTHQANLVFNSISANYDRALLQFSSNHTYKIATPSELPAEPELPTFAAGYSRQTGKFVTTSGQVTQISDQLLKEGYQIGYTNEIESGMSGGPILDGDMKLLGINGQLKFPIINTVYVYQDGTQPKPEEIEAMRQLSWGIPIDTVLGELNSNIVTAYNLPQPEIAEANTPALTEWLGELEAEAKQFTVKIDNTNGLSNGSGVIVAKENNTYAVLTADHVICERDNATQPCRDFVYEIVTHDGQRHQIEADKTRRQEGVDLAVVKFTSDENYQVAQLANYPLTQGDAVFVAGYPKLDNNKPAPWLFSLGYGFEREQGLLEVKDSSLTTDNFGLISSQGSLAGGYEMVYSSITYGGMSGGAVLDRDGRVIGIHGLAEGEEVLDSQSSDKKQVQSGFSLGIPINTFVGLTNILMVNSTLAIQDNKPKKLNTSETQAFQDAILGTEIPQSNATAEKWLERGNKLWRLRRNSEAVEAFDKAIELKPEFIHLAYYGKGLALGYERKYEAALKSLELATETEPSFAAAFLTKVVFLQQLNRLEEALSVTETASSLQPNNANLYNQKGNILFDLERYSEAKLAYNQAIKLNPRSTFYYNRGNVYDQQNKPDLAIVDFNKAISINSNDAKVYINRGLFYIRQDKPDLAIADLNKAISINSDYTKAYYNRGVVYDQQGKLDLAIADLNKAISIDREFAPAYLNRGAVYADQGKLDLAIADYNQVIDLNFDDGIVYYNRGNLYAQQGKLDLALSDYDKAIAINSNYTGAYFNAKVYYNRGTIYAQQGKLDLALSDYDKAIAINSNYAEVYADRGSIYARQGNPDLALNDFNQAIDLNHNDGDAYYGRGTIYVTQGQLDLALNDFNQAIDINHNDGDAYYGRGTIYLYQNKLDLALADFNQAILINPDDAKAYGNLALVYQKKGAIEAARANLQKAQKLFIAQGNTVLAEQAASLLQQLP
ncbi:tetratricopeptide repeat protein (plasmid) [Stanieria sp. NIES-3757]|nr:tetratricopeptide repeat protein [Stanieria sp. NIES-3757]